MHGEYASLTLAIKVGKYIFYFFCRVPNKEGGSNVLKRCGIFVHIIFRCCLTCVKLFFRPPVDNCREEGAAIQVNRKVGQFIFIRTIF